MKSFFETTKDEYENDIPIKKFIWNINKEININNQLERLKIFINSKIYKYDNYDIEINEFDIIFDDYHITDMKICKLQEYFLDSPYFPMIIWNKQDYNLYDFPKQKGGSCNYYSHYYFYFLNYY